MFSPIAAFKVPGRFEECCLASLSTAPKRLGECYQGAERIFPGALENSGILQVVMGSCNYWSFEGHDQSLRRNVMPSVPSVATSSQPDTILSAGSLYPCGSWKSWEMNNALILEYSGWETRLLPYVRRVCLGCGPLDSGWSLRSRTSSLLLANGWSYSSKDHA